MAADNRGRIARMMTLAQFLSSHCRPVTATDRRSDAEVAQQLNDVPDWHARGEAIARSFRSASRSPSSIRSR